MHGVLCQPLQPFFWLQGGEAMDAINGNDYPCQGWRAPILPPPRLFYRKLPVQGEHLLPAASSLFPVWLV